jgi:hypothetical protein
MMALLPIILFVTIDIYEKVRLLKCIRKMKKQTWSGFMANADNKHFPKNYSFFPSFFHNFIYCFLNQKINIHVNFTRVLWVAFSIPLDSLSLVKYTVCIFNWPLINS